MFEGIGLNWYSIDYRFIDSSLVSHLLFLMVMLTSHAPDPGSGWYDNAHAVLGVNH